jgi:hypothetical protein
LNKLKKIALSAALVFGTLVGGAVASAPAQADVEPMVAGTTVWFHRLGPNVPATIDLRNTTTAGNYHFQPYGTLRYNIAKTCPKPGWRMSYVGQYGNVNILKVDQCMVWGTSGTKDVGMHRP